MAKRRCTFAFRPTDTDGARLLAVLGARRFGELQAAFGGRRIWIPKSGVNMRCIVCSLRDRCIRTWRRRGMPAENIARSLGLSAKTVYRVLRAKDAPEASRPRRAREACVRRDALAQRVSSAP
ncbi:MAG: hypothetical protein HY079_03035 [Elusimicrobia bacterium]|nr:hypothetical protein [Elusimicrobiota bacterium]